MTEPEIGTDAWYERRRRLWNDTALDLMNRLSKYEDNHPDDAICLQAARDSAVDAAHDYTARRCFPS